MYQDRIQEEVVAPVQVITPQTMENASEDLRQRIESVQIITDPYKGNYLNMFM